MNTMSASELKQKGVSGIERHLVNGPVHVIKNNTFACVVLSENDYQDLLTAKQQSGLSYLLQKPATGSKTPKMIEKIIKLEKENWNK